MYRAYHTVVLDGLMTERKLFFDATLQSPKYQIMNPSLSLTFGKAGTFTFELPYDNGEYEKFIELVSYVDLYREDEIIFSGRVLSQSKAFNNVYTITCEGCLALLNDALAISLNGTPLESLSGTTIEDFMERLLSVYNINVDGYKNFSVGTVVDNKLNEAFGVTFSRYSTIMSILDAFTEQYDGYFQADKTPDGRFELSYYQNHNTMAVIENPDMSNPNQSIDFGKNLLDLTQETNTDAIASKLVAEGGNELPPVEVEDDAVKAKYGMITKYVSFNDITSVSNLTNVATQYLAEINAPSLTINASAVDLAKAGSNINFFKIGQLIRVRSKVHGLDEEFIIQTYDLNLLDPASSSISLGKSKTGYISRSKKSEINIYNEINNIKYEGGGADVEPMTDADIDAAIRGLL